MLPSDKWPCCPAADDARSKLPSGLLLLSAVHRNYVKVLRGGPEER